jgi:26S proteasome regulatory subunit N11
LVLQKPSIQALIHGLNRHYYSIVIEATDAHELHKQPTSGRIAKLQDHQKSTEQVVDKMLKLPRTTTNGLGGKDCQILVTGKIDLKRHLSEAA